MTDCGGEYNSQEFDEFCYKHGIKRQLNAAYTPQQMEFVREKIALL